MAGVPDLFSAGRRIVIAILLLMVSVHAAQPVGIPLDRSSGSAFSAATSDVSLASGQKTRPARIAVGIEPPAPASTTDIQPGNPARLTALPRSAARARGPPAYETIFSPLSPRAPPAA